MKTAIKSTRRIAAIVLSLALLCGVVVGTNMFVSANETEVTKYAVDFKDLAKVATDAGKVISSGYAATAEDATITAWVNESLGAMNSWDNATLHTTEYLGVPGGKYDKCWLITENGLKSSGKPGTHTAYGAALSLKQNGKYLQLKNFEASLVFNTDEYTAGSVFISFHEPGPGNVGVHNGSFTPTGDIALAVATTDCRAETNMYKDCQGIEVGTDGTVLASSTKWSANIVEADRFYMDGAQTTLGQYGDYKLNVKVVNGMATVTVTSVNGSVVYATKTTTVSDKVGTISIGNTGSSRVLESIEVTELDENGKAVDLGTLAAVSAENAYTVDFAKLAALVSDEQYGEGTTYQSQETDTAINDWVNERFELNYSGESHTFHDRTYLGQAISANSITAYWNIDKNGYIVNNTMSSGTEGIRSTESLTLKDKNGDLAVLDNFEATVVFKNTALHRGVVYIAFNEQTPGIFGWTGNYTSQPVLNRDAVLVGIMEDRVSDSGISVKGYGDAISDSLYGFNETFTNKLTAGDTAVEHQLYIKVIGNDLYVKVTTPSTGVVNWEKTYVDAVKGTSGTVSIGAGRGARAIKSISVTELDETGVPVDFGTANFEQNKPQSAVSIDFSELTPLVAKDEGTFTSGYYVVEENDTNINEWVAARFSRLTKRADGRWHDCQLLGQQPESWTNKWQIAETGGLGHTGAGAGGAYLEKVIALTLGNNGEDLMLKNFEASLVFNTSTFKSGSVFLSFHEQAPGHFGHDASADAAAYLQSDAVLVAANGDIEDNTDRVKYQAVLVRSAGESLDDSWAVDYATSLQPTTTLSKDTDYKLNVKVVNGTVTYTLTSKDGATTYYSGTDTVGNASGTISVGTTGQNRILKTLEVTPLDANGNVATDAALIGNDGVVDIVTADGYEVKAGSLIVTDANGNKFVPQRVGFREGGNASQYQVTDTNAVAPFTVDYEVMKPSLETPNIGNIGNSYNSSLNGLRFVSRFTREVIDGTEYVVTADGEKYAISDYGMLITSEPGLEANTGLTAEQALSLDAALAPVGNYVQKLSIVEANKFYDVCDDHIDMAVTLINIDKVQGYTSPETIQFYSRPYVVVTVDGEQQTLYGNAFHASYAEVVGDVSQVCL